MKLFQKDIEQFAYLEEFRVVSYKLMNLNYKITREHYFTAKIREEA